MQRRSARRGRASSSRNPSTHAWLAALSAARTCGTRIGRPVPSARESARKTSPGWSGWTGLATPVGPRGGSGRSLGAGVGGRAANGPPCAAAGSAPAAQWPPRPPERGRDAASQPPDADRRRTRAARARARRRTSRRRSGGGPTRPRRSRSAARSQRCLTVDPHVLAPRAAPPEARRACRAESRELLPPTDGLAETGRDRVLVQRVDRDRDAVGELAEGRPARADNGCSAGHRLQDRQPEPLVERNVRDASGAAVEPRELVVGDLAEPAHPVSADAHATPATGAHDAELVLVQPGALERAGEPA